MTANAGGSLTVAADADLQNGTLTAALAGSNGMPTALMLTIASLLLLAVVTAYIALREKIIRGELRMSLVTNPKAEMVAPARRVLRPKFPRNVAADSANGAVL